MWCRLRADHRGRDALPEFHPAAVLVGDGGGVRRVDERRFVLPSAGGVSERGFQARYRELHLARRQEVRFIISHDGDPATEAGIERVDAIKKAAKEAIKGTPLEGSSVMLAGTAATYKDMRDGSNFDLVIAGIAAVALIFIIMLVITRSVIAAFVIVGTVLLSLGASFGLSVLLWQHLLGIELHWMVLAMSGTGSVATSAGLVFAATMASFAFSELRIMGQVGTTIALGLLFDTLIVRSFMTPAIAAMLGRWFWWPQIVRSRPPRNLPVSTGV
jgi:RND superfamily putative drug exporter